MESKTIARNLLILGLILVVNLVPSKCNSKEDGELQIHETFKPDSCDRKAKSTDLLTLHYKGTLQDGQVFDSSYERNEPFTFQLGIGQVILGWEKGLLDACVGEKRRLVIPPHMGYGDVAHERIPAKSTLTFEIEVIKVEDGPKPVNIFKEIDTDGDKRLTRKEVGDYLRKQFQAQQNHGDEGSADDPDQTQLVDEIFMHEDKDKDDFITHDEFSGPKSDHDEL